MNLRGGLATLALCAASLTGLAHASADCVPNDASFRYSTKSVRTTFVVRPSCFGSRADVGDVRIHYTATRCDADGCTSLPEVTVTCKWSTYGCVRVLVIDHAPVERAQYSFGQDFTNSARQRVVAAGADTMAASCTSAGVFFACL